MNAAIMLDGFLPVSVAVSGAFVAFAVRACAPGLYLRFMARALVVALTLYALAGRGFAYVRIGPMFIGELLLAITMIGIAPALLRRRQAMQWRSHSSRAVMIMLAIFIAIGVTRTAAGIEQYAWDAARDAAVWYYSIFAIVTYYLLRRLGPRWFIWWYSRLAPWLLVLIPAIGVVWFAARPLIPILPGSPGISVLWFRSFDAAVHLVSALSFLLLSERWAGRDSNLGLTAIPKIEHRWVQLGNLRIAGVVTWGALAMVVTFSSRASILIALTGLALTLILAQLKSIRLLLPVIALGVLSVAVLTDARVTLRQREVSVSGLTVAVRSVVSDVGAPTLDGTVDWRLNWWRAILADARTPTRALWGVGYGPNLADMYGVRGRDQELRSPHNALLTLLARGGALQVAAFAAINVVILIGLVRALTAVNTGEKQRGLQLLSAWCLVTSYVPVGV